ncbi:hypothetical protein GCM10027614_68310 [Micromonospora vulcania]
MVRRYACWPSPVTFAALSGVTSEAKVALSIVVSVTVNASSGSVACSARTTQVCVSSRSLAAATSKRTLSCSSISVKSNSRQAPPEEAAATSTAIGAGGGTATGSASAAQPLTSSPASPATTIRARTFHPPADRRSKAPAGCPSDTVRGVRSGRKPTFGGSAPSRPALIRTARRRRTGSAGTRVHSRCRGGPGMRR